MSSDAARADLGSALDFRVQLVTDNLVNCGRWVTIVIVVVRRRIGAWSRVLPEDRPTGTGVSSVLDSILRRTLNHVIEELSPVAQAYVRARQLRFQFVWDARQVGIETLAHFGECGDGGRQKR